MKNKKWGILLAVFSVVCMLTMSLTGFAAGPLDGQIVVAVLDDAITLKRYYKEASRVRLQPENSTMQPIYCQDVRIVGILSNIVRTY